MLRKNKEANIEKAITKASFKVKVRKIPPLLRNMPPKAIKVGIPAKIGIRKVIRKENEKKRTCLIFFKYAENVASIIFGI